MSGSNAAIISKTPGRDAGSVRMPTAITSASDAEPGSNIVEVYVGYLRRKLGEGVIETARGMGYRLKS